MRCKLALILAPIIAALVVVVSGCNQTANDNANYNANAKVAVANTNTNTNANANTNRAPTRADYERNKDRYTQDAKSLGSKIGAGLDDGWLWTKTRFDLAAADDLRDSTINVDVENGVVTLSGAVANHDQMAKAESVTKAVEGVKGVKNLLKLANDNSNAANANRKPTPKK
jgi:hyperosmotically inducible protein